MVLTSSRWGDDEDDYLPPRQESKPDENGIRTIIEWKFNENGDKVKMTRKVKKVTKVNRVSKAVLERRDWPKFGLALSEGDNSNVTYTSHEEICMEDPNVVVDLGEKKEEESVLSGVKNSSIVVCRHCGMVGDHWTLKCPYKDTPADQIPKGGVSAENPPDAAGASAEETKGRTTVSSGTGGDKYIAPAMRNRGGEEGGQQQRYDDRENATLRVTNISSETREEDLQDLFRPFGPIARVYLAKDRETMQSRGFAFVSFQHRADAEKALNQLQGWGYDHLILKLEWAKPSTSQKSNEDAGSLSTTFRSGYGKALPQNINPGKN